MTGVRGCEPGVDGCGAASLSETLSCIDCVTVGAVSLTASDVVAVSSPVFPSSSSPAPSTCRGNVQFPACISILPLSHDRSAPFPSGVQCTFNNNSPASVLMSDPQQFTWSTRTVSGDTW